MNETHRVTVRVENHFNCNWTMRDECNRLQVMAPSEVLTTIK